MNARLISKVARTGNDTYATEFIQKYFIPNRDFSIYDITADIAGAVIGYVIVRIKFSRFKIPADTSI